MTLGLSPQFNRRSAVLVTAPAVEPVALADLKLLLKIDGTDEDGLLISLVATARRMAEEYTRRSFITQTWALTQDSFSDYTDSISSGYMIAPSPHLIPGVNTIHLPRGNVQSVVKIETTSAAGVVSIVDPATYALDAVNGDVVLNSGQSWPTDLRSFGGVKITYKAGYGDDASKVPDDIETAIKLQAQYLYDGCMGDCPVTMNILGTYRLPEAFGIL